MLDWDQSVVICPLLIRDERRCLVPHCTKKGGGQCNIDARVTVVMRTEQVLSLADMYAYGPTT